MTQNYKLKNAEAQIWLDVMNIWINNANYRLMAIKKI